MQAIKFKELRKYCSVIDRVSICFLETLNYKNYERIGLVPDLWDEKYVYGFGMIESEFDDTYKHCIEFMLSDKPWFDEDGNRHSWHNPDWSDDFFSETDTGEQGGEMNEY